MSFTALRQRNRGCYTSPFSGVGMEFFPAGMPPDQSGLLLHETGYLARNDWWNFPNTFSPFWRLYFNSRPGHKVIFADVEYELEPRHLVLIPDHQLFHSVGHKPVPHTWMSFQVALRLDPRVKVPILLRPTATERHLLREVRHQFTGIGTGNRSRILHLSLALLHLVLSRSEFHWQSDRPSDALLRTMRHMEAQPAEPFDPRQLARMAGLSVRGFAKAFQRHQGVTPGHYITQMRIRRSAELLVHTDETIDLVAERAGFPNRHYFTRVFKRLTGDTPAHFRHQHKAAA